ncbi:Predicted signal-transduction protein containing cAMP-binding and CBS domains [Olavius algarvensis Delta 1 endosymbiont]|nr:Predicted signal-transduction protein containing cAMP-binding and CBS domains [Olavius algarvensis Delta 1 endosymbiont]
MEDKISKTLAGFPLFSKLPKKELAFVAGEIAVKKYPKSTILAVQGRTKMDCVYIIKAGSMELFYESHGERDLKGILEPGEMFGGVSILMNAGISVRTVQVVADATLFVLSQKVFLEVCTRNKDFYEQFAGRFRAQMSNDSYASIVSAGQALHFISDLVPISFLPEEEISRIADSISIISYPRDTLLFVQGQSRLEYLYIIKKGAAERYFEENDEKTLRGLLGEGDMYGGISMLMNKGLAIRSLRVTEDSYFYILPKDIFLDVCQKYEAFSDYFTDTFGKRMLDRSYAEIIAGNFRPAEISPEFFNQPVASIVNRELVSCDCEMPIQAAAAVMSQHNSSSIFIREAVGEFIGLVTDNDLRNKVTATGYDILKPVSDIMTSPLVSVSSQALIFESMMEMMQKNIKHLAIRDSKNKVVGVITNRDLLKAQGQSPFFIVREIAQARFVNQIVQVHRQVPQLIQSLINTGAKAQNVTRFLTTVSDAILQKLIRFAIDEMGAPPARFAFMILGSEGRKEQTLKTDQDNAIIIEDLPEEKAKEAMDYFLSFSEKVCGWLDEVGYDFCKGGVMAKNKQWCQPLKVWKNYFKHWIRTAEPEALLQASIFFDFRDGYGDTELVDELRGYLFETLSGWAGFFRHLTENAMFFTPPIGFFRNFLVESKGEHRDSFDIKAAMQPVVDYARIYALNNRVAETNTLGRLRQLVDQNIVTAQQYQELDTVYSYLMQQRFVRQVKASTEENGKPDNYINPKKLSRIEQSTLKEIFKRIEKFQAKLSYDFTGMA